MLVGFYVQEINEMRGSLVWRSILGDQCRSRLTVEVRGISFTIFLANVDVRGIVMGVGSWTQEVRRCVKPFSCLTTTQVCRHPRQHAKNIAEIWVPSLDQMTKSDSTIDARLVHFHLVFLVPVSRRREIDPVVAIGQNASPGTCVFRAAGFCRCREAGSVGPGIALQVSIDPVGSRLIETEPQFCCMLWSACIFH